MKEHTEHSLQRWAEFLGVSTSGYYDWQNSLEERQKEKKVLMENIQKQFDASRKTYGAKRISEKLQSNGTKTSSYTVGKLMKELKISSIHNKHRTRSLTNSKKSRTAVLPNYTKGLAIEQPLQVIASDITYIKTSEGFLYMCVLKDVYSGLVLSHICKERMTKELVTDAIKSAVGRYGSLGGAIFHSDRGSQYTSGAVMELLNKQGILQSFSAVGCPGDNSWSESFFSIFKKESVHWSHYKTREECALMTFDYIEGFYNTSRIQKRLGYQSPKQFLKSLTEYDLKIPA